MIYARAQCPVTKAYCVINFGEVSGYYGIALGYGDYPRSLPHLTTKHHISGIEKLHHLNELAIRHLHEFVKRPKYQG